MVSEDRDVCELIVVGERKLRLENLEFQNGRAIMSSLDSDCEPHFDPTMTNFVPFLPFQLLLFDGRLLRDQILSELHRCDDFRNLLPRMLEIKDPDEFSFRLGSIFCVDDRRVFFSLIGTSARLRYLWKRLRERNVMTSVVCGECGVALASLKNQIEISDQMLHVNQHGVIHNLLTVSDCQNKILIGNPSEEHR